MILDLVHNTRMIHGAVTALSFTLFARHSYLDRLQAAIDQGATVEPDSAEERSLADDVKTLRMLALQIERARAQLIDNALPRFVLMEPSRRQANAR